MSYGVFRSYQGRVQTYHALRRSLVPTKPPEAFTLLAESGSYSVAGAAAALLYGRVVEADPGTYTVTGFDVGLFWGHLLNAELGTYTVVGFDAILTKSGGNQYTIDCAAGSYAVTGAAADLTAARLLAAGAGSYAISGEVLDALVNRLLGAAPGTYSVVGNDATFPRNYVVQAATGQYTVFGVDAALQYSGAAGLQNTWYITMRRRRR